MIVVSDTSPLNYLILVGQQEVLKSMFGEVIAPPSVIAELLHTGSPMRVKTWAAQPPAWLAIRSATKSFAYLNLDRGEADAIALAEELRADAILIDERQGRLLAEQRGLIAVGTLAVIEQAATKGLLDLDATFDLLLATNFRASRALIASIRERHRRARES